MHSVTTTEPEWDDTDRAWAIALLEVEADTCSGCGQPLSQTTRPEAEGGYETPPPRRCHACKSLHHRQEDYVDDGLASLRFTVQRTWRPRLG